MMKMQLQMLRYLYKKLIKAIDHFKALEPEGIPAIFLEKTKMTVTKLMMLFPRKIINESKTADVSPIHKRGSKIN